MKGRIFKFNPNVEPINGNMSNFLYNIVTNRPNQVMYLTGKNGKPSRNVAYNSINENDIILIQSKALITHYMYCNKQGPNLNINGEKEISVKDIKTLKNPISSPYLNQSFNILNKEVVIKLLNQDL
jgi:hypothetical protein